MPQTSPMQWTFIFCTVLATLMMMNSSLQHSSNSTKTTNNKMVVYKMKWQW